MKISMIQMNTKLDEPSYNFAHAKELLYQAASQNPDIITLPETWNTGFFPSNLLALHSDKNGEKTYALLSDISRKFHTNIVGGSVVIQQNNKFYNRSYQFDRNGNSLGFYDKVHLFSPMKEDFFFQKGNQIHTFLCDQIRCGIAICYDLRFPEWIRKITLDKIDILFLVAQWPMTRLPHLEILTQARAIENQIFVCCTNSCQFDGVTNFAGHSCIYDPSGACIQKAENEETILTATLDFSILKSIRKSIPIFQDRRTDLYH